MTKSCLWMEELGCVSGQLRCSFPSKKNKNFSTILNVQAEAVISSPFFKHKTMPWLAMFIHHCQSAGLQHPREAMALWKCTQASKAWSRAWGLAAISICVAGLLHGPWHSTWGPPTRTVSSQSIASQPCYPEKLCKTTRSTLLPAGTSETVDLM